MSSHCTSGGCCPAGEATTLYCVARVVGASASRVSPASVPGSREADAMFTSPRRGGQSGLTPMRTQYVNWGVLVGASSWTPKDHRFYVQLGHILRL